MKLRILSWVGTGAVLLLLAGAVSWLVSLPSSTPVTTQPAIGEDEARATLAALRPPKRQRPLVAVVGINNANAVTRGGGRGLANIKARANALGGAFTLHSTATETIARLSL